jgi:signal transduction histidine kinase
VYTGVSISALVAIRVNRRPPYGFGLWTHGMDIVVAAAVTLATEGSDGSFFAFLMFPLLAAAFRWGLAETVTTAITAVIVVTAETGVLGSAFSDASHPDDFNINRLIMRSTYLVIAGVLVGFLADQEKRRRIDAAAIARVFGRGRSEPGAGGTAHVLVASIARLFKAKRALLVLRGASDRVFLVSAEVPREGRQAAIASTELDEDATGIYLFDAPGDACYGIVAPDRQSFAIVGIDARGVRVAERSWRPPTAFLERHPARGILTAAVAIDGEWRGRVLLLDPEIGMDREDSLRLAQRLVGEIGPYVHEVARLQSLRSRAEGVERARLARELHDGVIQTLIGVDMQLEVLARRSGGTPADRASAISAIQTTLRRETVNLRDLTEEMKIGVAEVSPERVLDEVANLVDRFQRQTGIAAKFAGDRVAVRLPPNARREVLRVVHEGLVNVRKHSGARHVLVRASVSSDRLRLSIEDDGRGFSFQGTLTQQELESQLQGPAVIRERLRVLGGDISINSVPGRGARLDMTVPLKESA